MIHRCPYLALIGAHAIIRSDICHNVIYLWAFIYLFIFSFTELMETADSVYNLNRKIFVGNVSYRVSFVITTLNLLRHAWATVWTQIRLPLSQHF